MDIQNDTKIRFADRQTQTGDKQNQPGWGILCFTTFLKVFILTTTLASATGAALFAQRVITGTVYREGKTAAGVTVEAHKSSDVFMTSFDGRYKIRVNNKSKYLKFTFLNEKKKVDIRNNTDNVVDFSFDGNIPVNNEEKKQDDDSLVTNHDHAKAIVSKPFHTGATSPCIVQDANIAFFAMTRDQNNDAALHFLNKKALAFNGSQSEQALNTYNRINALITTHAGKQR